MAERAEAVLCPICEGEGSGAFMAGSYKMYRCRDCKTAFVQPMPGAAELADFYSQFHKSSAEGGYYDEIEERMEGDFPVKVAKVKSFVTEGKCRLLDVGCGKGFFVKKCIESGLEACGIDLSETAISYAREKLNVPAYCGELAGWKDKPGQFDAVTLWASVEHLADPVGMMQDIRANLRTGGYFFLDTGIGWDWLDRMLPGLAQWYDPPQHLFVFSEKGMRLMLGRAGFEVVDMDRCFEVTKLRRYIKIVRGFCLAGGLRMAAGLGRMRHSPFVFTRYPVGNLMSVVCRKLD